MTDFYALVRKGRSAPPAPSPDEQEKQRIREAAAAGALAARKARRAHAIRVLEPGTVVKPGGRRARFANWVVDVDPGPVKDVDRRVRLRRADPGRELETYVLRRDRITVLADMESMPDLGSAVVAMASSARTDEPLLDDSSEPPPGTGRYAIPATRGKRHGYRSKSVDND